MYKIFIVEDDPVIAGAVCDKIGAWGMAARVCGDFSRVLEEFAEFSPELVLLDISLPFYNGYHWCREIRKFSSVPVVFLSSASDNMNVVMAMNMGGDDFIAKPFDLDVLTAKLQAVLRRTYDFGGAASLITAGDAVLSLADGTLSYKGERVELTKNELRILETLMNARGAAVSRDALMTRLWETDSYVDENTLTVNVARLRRKLEGAGLPDLIKTRKGLGYIIER